MKTQVFSILGVSEPIIKATLACHSILRSPVHLLHCLLLGDILCLLQTFSFEVDVFVFPLEGFPVDRIDYGAIEHQVRYCGLGHRAAEPIGFSNDESQRRSRLVPTAGNLVKKPLNLLHSDVLLMPLIGAIVTPDYLKIGRSRNNRVLTHHKLAPTRPASQLSFSRAFSTIQSSSSLIRRNAVDKLRVLIGRERIAAKVAEMGQRISQDFAGEPVVLIGVLKGATIFLADLARQITLDVSFDFIAVSSYGNAKQQSGEVRLVKDVDRSMAGRNIILVEDILDTGLTLTYIQNILRAHHPKSLKIAALLDKVSRRTEPIHGDYVGFEIPDEFVVGYGLDFAEHYRNLPDICVLESGPESE